MEKTAHSGSGESVSEGRWKPSGPPPGLSPPNRDLQSRKERLKTNKSWLQLRMY